MNNISPTNAVPRAKHRGRLVICLAVLGLLLNACAVTRTETVTRLALLAPFEGRYREIGYNALYAARLALAEADVTTTELFPVDDGGSTATAAARARALAQDPLVTAALVVGHAAADEMTLAALEDIPSLVVGHWSAVATNDSVFILVSAGLDEVITVPGKVEVTEAARVEAPAVGSDIFALEQFARLRSSLDGITVASSAALPGEAFRERYQSSAEFAPEPGLLATLIYDATQLAASAMSGLTDRELVRVKIAQTTFEGLNGTIAFENGRWIDAPINFYVYVNGRLTTRDHVIK